MKKSDVPQQPHDMYQGETKGIYAVNEQGKLEISQTAGWQAESDVLEEAVAEIDRLATQSLARVRRGETSPLEYHMYAQRMDLLMLAQAVGRFQWRIKKHFSVKNFAKLTPEQLDLYARVLGISVATLKVIPNE